MTETLHISLIGFNGEDQGRFARVFQYSSQRERQYRLGEPPDIVVANGSDTVAMEEGECRARDIAAPLVVVSRNLPGGQSAYHIAPPLMTSRVLRVLDQIRINVDPRVGSGPSPQVPSVDVGPGIEDCRYRALVVDDSLAMRESLKQELSLLPMAVGIDFAHDGEQALALAAQRSYDLVFLDIVMPGIDGYEVCKRMRTYAGFRKTPIVMLSGKNSPLDEVKGIIAGASTYLTKPMAHEEFQKVLRRVVKWLDFVEA